MWLSRTATYIDFSHSFHEEETVSDMAPGPFTLSGMSLPFIHPIAWTQTTHKDFIRRMVPHENPKPSSQIEGRAAPRMASP